MSLKELKRVSLIDKVASKVITQVKASKILELTTRQVRRIRIRVLEEGPKGVIHRSRGKPSGRSCPDKKRNKILNLCRTKYKDFNPTLASEKLFEINGIKISREALRGWFKKESIPYDTRKKRPHRNWRERKHQYGEMQQVDGSHHDWFEGRAPQCVLMAYIDDATSRVYAQFHEYEGTLPFMASFKGYTKKYDLPKNIYIDRHTTYKSPKESSIEDELKNREPESQVQRALGELEVEVTFAYSPQAKGRVERLFRTFQDRVVKEMRLKGIGSIKEGNSFLRYYLPVYNRRFGVEALEKGDLHTPLPKSICLDRILCKRTLRALNKDSTVKHDRKLYHVLDKIYAKKVAVEERINGKIYITFRGKELKYKEITKRPIRKESRKPYIFKLKRTSKAAENHPWRGTERGSYPHNHSYSQKEKSSKKEKGLLLLKA